MAQRKGVTAVKPSKVAVTFETLIVRAITGGRDCSVYGRAGRAVRIAHPVECHGYFLTSCRPLAKQRSRSASSAISLRENPENVATVVDHRQAANLIFAHELLFRLVRFLAAAGEMLFEIASGSGSRPSDRFWK
jgi:hypothetical protein